MSHSERRARLETDARRLFHAAQAAPTAEAVAALDMDLWDLAEQLYRMRHPAAQDRRMAMHETWDPERLLRDCDHALRSRHTDVTRDLLTEPRWGKWEGVADYEDGPATQIDAREVRVPIHTARPEYAARVAFWCLLACGVLVVAGGLWEWVR